MLSNPFFVVTVSTSRGPGKARATSYGFFHFMYGEALVTQCILGAQYGVQACSGDAAVGV
jgi:hypothetical protein